MKEPDDTELREFLLDFLIAKARIRFAVPSERLRKHTEGAILQHSRWREMGHRFVFSGLDHMIQSGKCDDV